MIDEELAVPSASEAFEPDGSLRDPDLRSHLEDILEQIVLAVPAPLRNAA